MTDLALLLGPRVSLENLVKRRASNSSSHLDDLPREPPNLLDPQPIVQVHITNNTPPSSSEPFRIHKNFICHYSPYFKAAFEGSFAEGESQESHLEGIDPEVFGIFVNWLYTQTIQKRKEAALSCRILTDLWLLADRFLIPRLQDEALQKLDQARVQEGHIPISFFNHIYNNTCEQSPLRQYLVATFNRPEIANAVDYPPQMLADLLNSTIKYQKRVESFLRLSSQSLSDDQLRLYYVCPAVERKLKKQKVII